MGSYRRMPHLWRAPNGYLYIVFSDRGRWVRRSTKTRQKAPAEAALRAFLEGGGEVRTSASRPTLSAAAQEWFQDRKSVRRGLAAITLKEYGLSVQRLAETPAGALRADQVEPRDIRAALQRLEAAGASANVQKRFLNHLRMMFRWLRRQEIVRENPAEVVELPKVQRGRRPAVTPEQFVRLRAAAEADLAAGAGETERREAQLVLDLLDVLWHSGLRSIEAMRLRWKDVDLEARTWRIRSAENKGGDQVLPMHDDVVRVLRRRRLEAGSEVGPFAAVWHVKNAWRRFKGRHPEWEGWSLHSLRHGFVTRIRAAHGDAAASFLARHKSRSMTEHYSHFDAETFRAALESK